MERIIEEIREDLDRRIGIAADRLADRTLTEDPAYAARLGRAELRERIHLTLTQAVEGLVRGARGLPAELAGARATGALRAEQGVPLASVRRTYRRGGRLLWQSLTEAVAAHDRAELPGLLPGAMALWDVLDQMTDAASEAYLRTEAERGERERELRAALLDTLLDGGGTADGAAAAAGRLGLAARGRFAVVVLAAGTGTPGTDGPTTAPGTAPASGPGTATGPGATARPGAAAGRLRGGPGPGADVGGLRVLWRVRADGETGLVDLGHHPLDSLRELLAPLGVPAGISPVVSAPAALAGARRLAALALRTAPATSAPGAVLLDERLPAALVAGDPELAGRLREVVLGPVLALPPEDTRVLLDTLGTWLACRGSTTYAAQRLYCHRNTVSNRLRRLEQLTGRALSDPAHVVELALAHAAVTQRAATPAAPPPPAPRGAPGAAPTPAGTARRSPRPPG
ncbi:PucR family transcriptional regulator [Streptomyces lavendulae subsp. lavendulae]|uniref:PucR family transcriptional regulator n=1 Tax=Streptomyces lavendulae TaxID=1914 RepID=UPI0024A3BDE1|nr:helix-turn-helix domain-containing protein [Streptomyces lavendulae]GLV82227.1 PucR family transcriptional regulator [Streptomyces lavendulae subsp. lavendulae]